MYLVTEYQFHRSKTRPDLYRFRYYHAEGQSESLIAPRWRSWSRWINLEQIKKIIKERRKFPDLEKGLVEMKPGSTRRKKFVEVKKKRSLYLWNSPSDVFSARLDRLVRYASLPAPTTSMLVIEGLALAISTSGYTSIRALLERFLKELGLEKDDCMKVLTTLDSDPSQIKNVLLSQIDKINNYLSRENAYRARITSLRNDLFQVEGRDSIYQLQLDPPSCSCDSYQKIRGPLKQYCKHLYLLNRSTP